MAGKHARKVDQNQKEVVTHLRAAGFDVEHLYEVGRGVPDLLLGFMEMTFLLEVKRPGGKLNPGQQLWHRFWRGQVTVADSATAALADILDQLVELQHQLPDMISKVETKLEYVRQLDEIHARRIEQDGTNRNPRRTKRKRKVYDGDAAG